MRDARRRERGKWLQLRYERCPGNVGSRDHAGIEAPRIRQKGSVVPSYVGGRAAVSSVIAGALSIGTVRRGVVTFSCGSLVDCLSKVSVEPGVFAGSVRRVQMLRRGASSAVAEPAQRTAVFGSSSNRFGFSFARIWLSLNQCVVRHHNEIVAHLEIGVGSAPVPPA